MSDEDRVIYLLASLPQSFNVLVTALEASTEVPAPAVVRECLLHKETKWKSKAFQEAALTAGLRSYGVIFVTNQVILRRTVRNTQSLRFQSSLSKIRRKLRWEHLR